MCRANKLIYGRRCPAEKEGGTDAVEVEVEETLLSLYMGMHGGG